MTQTYPTNLFTKSEQVRFQAFCRGGGGLAVAMGEGVPRPTARQGVPYPTACCYRSAVAVGMKWLFISTPPPLPCSRSRMREPPTKMTTMTRVLLQQVTPASASQAKNESKNFLFWGVQLVKIMASFIPLPDCRALL